jgi:hypothetical protein
MNTYQFKQTGGGNYASLRATWPFAKLTVNENQLSLNISLCTLYFRPADVVSIEPSDSGGIRINHTVSNYKTPVIFKSSGDARELIEQIARTGFLNNKSALPPDVEANILNLQAQGGFAIKLPAIILIIIGWNAILLPNFYRVIVLKQDQYFHTGPRLSSGYMILICLGLIFIAPFRELILKEGRTLDDVKLFVCFILALCIAMLIISSIMPTMAA